MLFFRVAHNVRLASVNTLYQSITILSSIRLSTFKLGQLGKIPIGTEGALNGFKICAVAVCD